MSAGDVDDVMHMSGGKIKAAFRKQAATKANRYVCRLAGWPSTPKIYLGHAEGSYIKDVPIGGGMGELSQVLI